MLINYFHQSTSYCVCKTASIFRHEVFTSPAGIFLSSLRVCYDWEYIGSTSRSRSIMLWKLLMLFYYTSCPITQMWCHFFHMQYHTQTLPFQALLRHLQCRSWNIVHFIGNCNSMSIHVLYFRNHAQTLPRHEKSVSIN